MHTDIAEQDVCRLESILLCYRGGGRVLQERRAVRAEWRVCLGEDGLGLEIADQLVLGVVDVQFELCVNIEFSRVFIMKGKATHLVNGGNNLGCFKELVYLGLREV